MIKNKLFFRTLKKGVIIFCIFFSTMLMVLPIVEGERTSRSHPPIYLNSGWDVYTDGTLIEQNATLPYSVSNTNYKYVDLYKTINNNEFKIPAVSFVAFQKNAWVYLDDVLLKEIVFDANSFNQKYPGSGTVMTDLPKDFFGKKLHIRLENLMPGIVSPIASVILLDGIVSPHSTVLNPSVLLMMSSLFIISILALIICFFYRKIGFNLLPLVSLSLIIASLSLWSLCNSKMIEIFISNWGLIHNLEYLSFYIIPISIWMYIKYNWDKHSKVTQYTIDLMLVFFAITLILKCFFSIDFVFVLPVFHILCLLNVPLFIYELVKNYPKSQPSYKVFAMGLLIITGAGAIDLIKYYTVYSTESMASVFIAGIVVFCFTIIIAFIFSTKEKMDNNFDLISKRNLEDEHRRYEILIKNTQDVFLDWNLADDSVYFSQQFENFFGKIPTSLDLMKTLHDNVLNIDFDPPADAVYSSVLKGTPYEHISGSFINKYGVKKWFDASITTIFDNDRVPSRVIGIIKDVTETKKLELEFESQSQYLKINEQLYDNIFEADITCNITVGERCNILMEQLGLKHGTSYEELIKAKAYALVHPNFKEEYVEKLSRDRILSLYNNDYTSFTYEYMELDNGEYQWMRLEVQIFRLYVSNNVRIISYVKNINEDKLKEEVLLNTSRTDSLSKLLNRGAAKEEIDRIIEETKDTNATHAFLMIDADKFKNINDTLGHAFGDDVIEHISHQLKQSFNEDNVIGRVGGDEFAVFVRGFSSIEALEVKCKELCKTFNQSFTRGDKSCCVTISIGVCISPQDGNDYDTLYKNADLALYHSKNKGRNTYSFYSELKEQI